MRKVSMPEIDCGESHLDRIDIEGIQTAYVMSNAALERILFNRNLVGLDFTQSCQTASEAFFRHFSSEISALDDDVAELLILSKGIYYWLHNAFASVFNRNLEANLIATKRTTVIGTSVKIDAPYSDFSAPASNLIIADTIASGATIAAALAHYLQSHSLRKVFIFSIAGSVTGGRLLASFCKEHDIEMTIVYGLAAFGLSENGFDLSFLHPETICPNKSYMSRAHEMFRGQPVSAVGWDFGSQAQATRKYRMLCWIEAEYWGLQDSDVFRIKESVSDPELVQKEAAAYNRRVSIKQPAKAQRISE